MEEKNSFKEEKMAEIRSVLLADLKSGNDTVLDAMLTAVATRALELFDLKKGAKLLTRDEVAERYHIDKSTLWRWDRIGFLRPTIRAGRRCLYSEESLLKVLASQSK